MRHHGPISALPKIAVAGETATIAPIVAAILKRRAGRPVVIGSSAGGSAALAGSFAGEAEAGSDLRSAEGCAAIILAAEKAAGIDIAAAAACVGRAADGSVVIIACEASNRAAAAFLSSARIPARQVIATGGLPDQRSRSAALAMSLGVSRSQVSLLVAGDEGRALTTLSRYTRVAGIPARILADSLLDPANPAGAGLSPAAGRPAARASGVDAGDAGPASHLLRSAGVRETSWPCRAQAAAIIAESVTRDRRRVLCCGIYSDGGDGFPPGYLTRPAVIGGKGVEGAFAATLTLEERVFVQRAAASTGR